MKTLPLIPIAVILAGCGHEPPPKTEAAAPPVAVQTVPAATVEWNAGYEASGTVRARTTAVLSAKVMGYVREVNAQAGDRVKSGQVLVTLDSRDLEAEYRRAEAGKQEALAALPEIEHGMAAAKANLELAQVTFKRMDDLFHKKSISNQEYDEAGTRLKGARANYEMALAKRSQVQARIAQAEQARTAAEVMRGYAAVTAPFAGVITARQAEPGSMAAPGAPLLTIEREGAYRLEVPVEESKVRYVRTGQPVSIALEALDRELTAPVGEIVPAVDAGSRAYTVKIDLPSLPQVRSGMFGRATFPMAKRQLLAVPAGAVVERGQLQAVMVADNGVARTRLVTLGQRVNQQVEILSGLTAGEKLIHPAPANLADGARVEVRP